MTINALVAEGDSLTFALSGYFFNALSIDNSAFPSDQGAGVAIRKWARWKTADPALLVANMALSGSKLSQLVTRAAALDALLSADSNRRYILALLIGTNLDTSNPTTFAASVADYCQARVAAGWDNIILGTIPSRTDGNMADFDTAYAQPYNAIIKGAGWAEANGVSVIADYAGDARIGGTGAANNATYFSDTVHPTAAGYAIMGPILASAITAALAT